ncbi:MAG TPA: hypothetical protein VJ850_02735 [Candidatus Limnocylindrales bacterium]|nr:hypothetical protein [Candidatus Limnocylindrales bacterium]
MARRSSRSPGRTSRSKQRAVGVGVQRPGTAAQPTDAVETPASEPAGLEARLAFALGVMAFFALPISYQWTFRPSSRPAGTDGLIPILELGAIIAAGAALLLGRRARAAGDRSTGAIWGPRLGAAAIVGYVMVFFVLMTRT